MQDIFPLAGPCEIPPACLKEDESIHHHTKGEEEHIKIMK